MGKKTPSPPPAPDPVATAQAQAAANKEAVIESAKVNQINQETPFGSVSFSGEIGSPERTRTETLSPAAQALLEGQQDIAQGLTSFGQQIVPQVADALTPQFSLDGLPAAPTVNDDARNRVEEALFSRLSPQLDRDREQLRSQLSNRGINEGDQAFGSAFDDFNRGVNDLRLGITAAGGAEQSNQFNLAQAERGQAINERLLERSQPLNELAALLQGSPATPLPQFSPTAQFQVAPPDVIGAHALSNQIAQQNFATQQAGRNSALGGIAGLGGALLGGIGAAGGFGNFFGGTPRFAAGPGPTAALTASDRRLKTDIKRVGRTDEGLPVYTYRFKSGGPIQMGVMAQDLEKVKPEAVLHIGGVKHVDYGQVA